MNEYLAALLDSELPVDAWLVALVWLGAAVGSHFLSRFARSTLGRQDRITSGHRLIGSALACLLLGLFLVNLALLGGAFVLGSAGAGYLRRARIAGSR